MLLPGKPKHRHASYPYLPTPRYAKSSTHIAYLNLSTPLILQIQYRTQLIRSMNITLHARYAMTGTHISYPNLLAPGTDIAHPAVQYWLVYPISLRACYNICGTELAYGATTTP
eukprot:466981-Rhodomonas_salina.2